MESRVRGNPQARFGEEGRRNMLKFGNARTSYSTKLYNPNSEFITYAHKNGFIHSPFHYAKRIIDCGPLIGNPDFNEIFSMLIKGGIFIPIRKDKVI